MSDFVLISPNSVLVQTARLLASKPSDTEEFMSIALNDLLKIEDPKQYKLHLACREPGGASPLDEYVTDRADWIGWNQWRGSRDDWTREYVFTLIEYYPKPDHWLFGGVFRVVEKRDDGYRLESVAEFEKYEGRLLVKFHRYQGLRGRAFYLDSFVDQMEVAEILSEPYSGEAFSGYDQINHDFATLEVIFKKQRADWLAALSNVKGVYLITDNNTGKMYVGSAYGDAGIWSRWGCYIGTCHGWNDGIVALLKEQEEGYAKKHFKFAILEPMRMDVPDEVILQRESHWKEVLMSREFGYNKN